MATGSVSAGNCDDTRTPDQQLASAEQNESAVESELESECALLGQPYCQQEQSDEQCLSGLIQVGETASKYPFSGVDDVVSGFADFAGVERAGM